MRLILVLIVSLLSIGAKPIDVNEINRLGAEATRQGDYLKAVELFRQAYALEPDQPLIKSNLFNALNNAAVTHAQAGEVDAAIAACSHALDLVPQDVRVASNLAIFFHNHAVEFLSNDDYDGARREVMNAQKVVDRFRLENLAPTLQSTHARIYLLEARSAFRRNEVGKALDLYQKCIEVNPEEPYAYLDRSRIYYDQNSFQDAISDLELAIQILGETPELAALLKRLELEAEEKGQKVSDQDSFFVFEALALSPSEQQALRRMAKETRLGIARDLGTNPKSQIFVAVNGDQPLVRVGEWMRASGNKIRADRIELGSAGVTVESEDFRKAFRFHYLATLTRNAAGEAAPYWFAAGLGLYFLDGVSRLTPRETEEILAAGDNFLLLHIEDLTDSKLALLEDSRQIHLANLQSKALVEHLVNTIRVNGVRQLLRSLAEGVSFDQALMDVGNLKLDVLDSEWRNFLGLPPR